MKKTLKKASDAELLDRYDAGDENAFRMLVNRYKEELYAFLRRFLIRQDLVEDFRKAIGRQCARDNTALLIVQHDEGRCATYEAGTIAHVTLHALFRRRIGEATSKGIHV